MNRIPHFKPGDSTRIRSAATMNAVMDAVRHDQRKDFSPDEQSHRNDFPFAQNTQIWVRNDTGHTFNRYDTVGLDEPIWLPAHGAAETEQHLNDPIYSVSRLNHCRHRGRWAVLTAPLPPCGIVRAVMSGGTNAWIPPTYATPLVITRPVSLDVSVFEEGELSLENGQANLLYGSGQLLWVGAATNPGCEGTVDFECRADGMKWLVIANNCTEGCSAFACDDSALYSENLPCTPFDRIYNHQCCPSELALLRIGNVDRAISTIEYMQICHICFDAVCKYECVQRQGEWLYQQVRDCNGDEVVPTTGGIDPSTTANPSTTADPVPQCQCPDLNALVIDDPIRYPPCGPEQCPPQILIACDTTPHPPPPTTILPSTTPPPTTIAPTTSLPPCLGQCEYECSAEPYVDGVLWRFVPTYSNCSPASQDCSCGAYNVCNVLLIGNDGTGNIYQSQLCQCDSRIGGGCGPFETGGIAHWPCVGQCGSTTPPPTTLPPTTFPPTTSGPSTSAPTTTGTDPSTTAAATTGVPCDEVTCIYTCQLGGADPAWFLTTNNCTDEGCSCPGHGGCPACTIMTLGVTCARDCVD